MYEIVNGLIDLLKGYTESMSAALARKNYAGIHGLNEVATVLLTKGRRSGTYMKGTILNYINYPERLVYRDKSIPPPSTYKKYLTAIKSAGDHYFTACGYCIDTDVSIGEGNLRVFKVAPDCLYYVKQATGEEYEICTNNFNADNEQVLWRKAADSIEFVGHDDSGKLYTLEEIDDYHWQLCGFSRTGAKIFTRAISRKSEYEKSWVGDDGYIYVIGGQTLRKHSPETGELVNTYTYTIYKWMGSIATDSDGNIYWHSSQEGCVRSIAPDGAPRWATAIPDRISHIEYVNGTIFGVPQLIGAFPPQHIYEIDSATGEIKGETNMRRQLGSKWKQSEYIMLNHDVIIINNILYKWTNPMAYFN